MFCCTLLYVHSSNAIILMGKRELVALLNLSSWCLVMVEGLFLAIPRGCLRFVIVVFPDYTHLLFFRTECSSLNFYLHQRNLVHSPNCVCGAIENNKPYLLDCHRYVNARDEMLNIVIRCSNSTVWKHGSSSSGKRRNFKSCTSLYSQNEEVHAMSHN